jgi:spore coat protein U-like protein
VQDAGAIMYSKLVALKLASEKVNIASGVSVSPACTTMHSSLCSSGAVNVNFSLVGILNRVINEGGRVAVAVNMPLAKSESLTVTPALLIDVLIHSGTAVSAFLTEAFEVALSGKALTFTVLRCVVVPV